ncbi:tri1 [Symbiodinium sp. CCMP2456]|nr:tri1 [Symbiodinium sp. CCMP2456]
MGVPQSKGSAALGAFDESRIFTFPDGLWLVSADRFADDALVDFQFLTHDQQQEAQAGLEDELAADADRAVGCLLGLAIGDALGAPLEFHPVRYKGDPDYAKYSPLAGFDEALWQDKSEMRETNRFLLQMGQWTDDTAMALCLADSLLAHNGLHPRDLRLRFLAWWRLGYNNAFRLDADRSRLWGSRASIGCGGIVGESLQEFRAGAADYTRTGTIHSSGNGSLMRNAPVPILYHRDIHMAMEAAWRQSKTTHQGDEAADCARLLTWICLNAIVSGSGKAVLQNLDDFPARFYSTKCLAQSQQEERCADNTESDLADRDWRWRSQGYRYSPKRAHADPGYAGSYAMDCLAMALHCVHVTDSFESALLHAANLCGDADTVAAVTGQIAGAIYGASAVPGSWLQHLHRWDDGNIPRRAWLLFTASQPADPAAGEQQNRWTTVHAEPHEDGDETEPFCDNV